VTFSISRWTILGLIGVVLLAAFVRFDGLGTPDTFIADEGFYAPDVACMCMQATSVIAPRRLRRNIRRSASG
jgi:hypothetical protein